MSKCCANCRVQMDADRVFIPNLPKKYIHLDFCSLSCANSAWLSHKYEIEHYDELEAERARCNVCELRMRCTRYLSNAENRRYYKCLKESNYAENQC